MTNTDSLFSFMEGQVTREELATLAHRGGIRIRTDRLEGILPADILAAVREWNETVVALLAPENNSTEKAAGVSRVRRARRQVMRLTDSVLADWHA
jgi:hypothetical protein